MQPPHPPRPPLPGPADESDRALVARLGGPDADGRHHAVALLLARHWPATRDHAVVCLAAAGPTAQLVATAAFHRVLGGVAGVPGDGALRPRLLVAVRDTVRAWAADDTACAVLPELRKTTGGRGLRAAKPGPSESRQLAARAFRALPDAAQCLLWHTEAEAEPINIPAGLLGIDTVTATAALERAREQFRAGCVRAHRELAPTGECRSCNRLLDISVRRGGLLPPDARRHLTDCRHCRYAAEQLGHFDGGLPLLLAESVLGWGARRYLASRPARTGRQERPPAPEWPAPAPPRAPNGRHRKVLAVGVGLTSLALLATALAARTRPDDNGVPGPGSTWAAPAVDTAGPVGTGRPVGTGARSAASSGDRAEIAGGTLRELASGRCLDVRAGRVAAGAGVRLASCSAAVSQQWTYQGDDGLLRSAADPALCLTADPATRTVALAGCPASAAEASYDFTLHGEILIRRHPGLALAPGPGPGVTGVSVVHRDHGARERRWVLEADGAPRGGAVPEWRPKAPGATDRRAEEPRRPHGVRVREGEGGQLGRADDQPGRAGDHRHA
ncbi:ricin-type beta-trefoil lectin domain protein [Streptomyces sp. NPDC017638]|uniref:RICIN domain-containing protein n=1 Tax=Streptomyces sp. NPDC017638 TaxID=3365004 RepID=UPI0037A6865A